MNGNVSNGCLPLVSSSECDTEEVRLIRLHLLGVLGELLCKEFDIFYYVTSVSKAHGPSSVLKLPVLGFIVWRARKQREVIIWVQKWRLLSSELWAAV
ncbi:hypothetical protein HID58_086887, partial [Brassica napus]